MFSAATKSSSLSSDTEFEISRSLRFIPTASPYLERTPSTTTSRTTFTISMWVKIGRVGTNRPLVSVGNGVNNRLSIYFDTTDQLKIDNITAGVATNWRTTVALYRDVSAWYHLIFRFKTDSTSASDRVRIYVNKVEQSFTGSTPAQNFATYMNLSGNFVRLGYNSNVTYFDGYMAEVHVVDDQPFSTNDFGQFDPVNGVWSPKKYMGGWGTNGFYVNFSDDSASTATTLGKDYSGNGNNLTPTNLSVTPGTAVASMIDVPVRYDDGGTGRGNYCVLNVLDLNSSIGVSNGGLDHVSSNVDGIVRATFGMSSGKWYWEVKPGNQRLNAGISNASALLTDYLGENANGWGYYGLDGNKYNNATGAAYGATYTSSDTIGVAFDADNGTLTFYKNGSSQGVAYSSLPAGTYFPTIGGNGTGSSSGSSNFGQRAFSYTPPTGYKALNTFNLPDPLVVKGDDYFEPVLYTGTSATRSVTGLPFTPDLVWIKVRSGGTAGHFLFDSVRGTERSLSSNTTGDESNSATTLTSFNSDGFSLGSSLAVNTSTWTYASWNWAKGATPGFDIVTYTGNGAGRTIAHSIGDVPKVMIVKARTTAGTDQGWVVYHSSMASPAGSYLNLQATNARATSTTVWNNTAPTSSVFSVGNNSFTNQSGDTFVAYLWSEVPGFSKFGVYTGNGSTNGPFVDCGFRPAFVMLKISSSTGNWYMFDNGRLGYNATNRDLIANTTGTENSFSYIDILSNGFKHRSTLAGINASGATYTFMAFAENPFKYALAR